MRNGPCSTGPSKVPPHHLPRSRRLAAPIAWAWLVATPSGLLSAQQHPLLPEAYEIAMARSAAPTQLSDSADVYVLRRGGFVRVVRGTNGAACMVNRDHPESLYPICFDPEAARTILPGHLERQRLREIGLPEDSAAAKVDREYAEGRIPVPGRPAIAYMMSRHQVIYAGYNGRRVGAWFPHLMIYMPHQTRVGLAMPGMPNGDLTLSDEGQATAHYVVMTRDWSNAPPLPPRGPALRAEPGWVCPGDEYVLQWSGAPNALVTAIQGGERTQTVLTNPLRRTAREQTILSAADPAAPSVPIASDTVSVHPERMEHNFVRAASSCSGRLAVASMGLPPAHPSDRIRPQGVTNRGAHPVTVTHRGRSIRLAPGETTLAFNDLPFSGDWGVIVDTGPWNDACPQVPGSGQPTPPPVDLLIVTACREP